MLSFHRFILIPAELRSTCVWLKRKLAPVRSTSPGFSTSVFTGPSVVATYFSPIESRASHLYVTLSSSNVRNGSSVSKNIQPLMVLCAAIGLSSSRSNPLPERSTNPASFKAPPYIQNTPPANVLTCRNLTQSELFIFALTAIESRLIGMSFVFVTLTNNAMGIGAIVSPKELRYRRYQDATSLASIPVFILNTRPPSPAEYFTTTRARIHSAAVPIEAKVMAAALICVLVSIATTKKTHAPKNATVAFCTHPLDSA